MLLQGRWVLQSGDTALLDSATRIVSLTFKNRPSSIRPGDFVQVEGVLSEGEIVVASLEVISRSSGEPFPDPELQLSI